MRPWRLTLDYQGFAVQASLTRLFETAVAALPRSFLALPFWFPLLTSDFQGKHGGKFGCSGS